MAYLQVVVAAMVFLRSAQVSSRIPYSAIPCRERARR